MAGTGDDFFDEVSINVDDIDAALQQLGMRSDDDSDDQSRIDSQLARFMEARSGDENDNNAARSALIDYGSETLVDDLSDSKPLPEERERGRARRSLYYDSDDDIDDRLLSDTGSINSEENNDNVFDQVTPVRSFGGETLEGSYNVLPALDEGQRRDETTLIDFLGRPRDAAGSSEGGFRSFDFDEQQFKYGPADRLRLAMLWNNNIRGVTRAVGLLAGSGALMLYAGDIKVVSERDLASRGRVVALLSSTAAERDRARELIEIIHERFLADPERYVAERKKQVMAECIEVATLVALGLPISVNDTEAALVLRADGRQVDIEYELVDRDPAEQEAALKNARNVLSKKREAEAARDAKVAKLNKRLAAKEAELTDLRQRTELLRRVGPIRAETPGAAFDLTDEQRFDRSQRMAMGLQRQQVTAIGKLKQKVTKAQNSKSFRRAQRDYDEMLEALNENPGARAFLQYCEEAEQILDTLPQRLLELRNKFLQAETQIRDFVADDGQQQQMTTKRRAKIRQPSFA